MIRQTSWRIILVLIFLVNLWIAYWGVQISAGLDAEFIKDALSDTTNELRYGEAEIESLGWNKKAEADSINRIIYEIRCDSVPIIVYRGIAAYAVYGQDEWGNEIVKIPAREPKCPEGTHLRAYEDSLYMTYPVSYPYECVKAEIKCDTVYKNK